MVGIKGNGKIETAESISSTEVEARRLQNAIDNRSWMPVTPLKKTQSIAFRFTSSLVLSLSHLVAELGSAWRAQFTSARMLIGFLEADSITITAAVF
jgi:hypothetical protein